MLEKSQFAKLSPIQIFPLYGMLDIIKFVPFLNLPDNNQQVSIWLKTTKSSYLQVYFNSKESSQLAKDSVSLVKGSGGSCQVLSSYCSKEQFKEQGRFQPLQSHMHIQLKDSSQLNSYSYFVLAVVNTILLRHILLIGPWPTTLILGTPSCSFHYCYGIRVLFICFLSLVLVHFYARMDSGPFIVF